MFGFCGVLEGLDCKYICGSSYVHGSVISLVQQTDGNCDTSDGPGESVVCLSNEMGIRDR